MVSELKKNNSSQDCLSKQALSLVDSENGIDPPVARAVWGSKLQYLLTLISYAIGLGNIWRFPYLCQQNGGGAFLIPYVLMLVLEGVPLFYLELGIGQRIRKGSIGVWNEISPFLGGLGISSAIVSFIIGLYYNVIIAWCLYYIFMSFRRTLPWAHCPMVVAFVPNHTITAHPEYITLAPLPADLTTPLYSRTSTEYRLTTPKFLITGQSSAYNFNSNTKKLGYNNAPVPSDTKFPSHRDTITSNEGLKNNLTRSSVANNATLNQSHHPLLIPGTRDEVTANNNGSLDNASDRRRLDLVSPVNANDTNASLLTKNITKRDASNSGNNGVESLNYDPTSWGKPVSGGGLIPPPAPNKSSPNLVRVLKPITECQLSSSTQYFWYRTTLDISSGIDEVTSFNWKIMLLLGLAWTLVFLCIMKGIKSSGKASYFTATFPYAVLIIIFGRAITLKGANLGLIHLFKPKVEKLLDPSIWLDAATQVFYSLGLGFGSIIAFSSYNSPNNDCRKDAILVSIISFFTSIFASIVIFSVLGFKALTNFEQCLENNHESIYDYYDGSYNLSYIGANYETFLKQLSGNDSSLSLQSCSIRDNMEQAAEGTGLAFIVFAQALVEFPGSPFWSIIFFMMLITLGMGTMFGIMESIITSIHDLHLFPWLRKEILSAILCSVSFFVGIIFVLSSGEYWVKLFDTFAGTLTLVIIAFFEIMAVSYVYGHRRFSLDLERMTGHYPNWYWQLMWRFISPALMVVLLLASIVKWIINPPTYKIYNSVRALLVEKPYPTWILGIIAIIILLGSLSIPLVAFLRYFNILKFETDIPTSVKRFRATESTSKIISSTTTLSKLEEIEALKPNLKTIHEVP